jgi:hypothetical protein
MSPRETIRQNRRVPIYYFHIHDHHLTIDEEGVDRADDVSALAYAIRAARSLAAADVSEGHLTLSDRIEIDDENHRRVATIRFDQAVAITP